MNESSLAPDLDPQDLVPAKPTRSPVLVSALVMPGAGQCMQNRWVAGLIFGISFTGMAVMMLVYIFKILKIYYSLALDTTEDADAEKVADMVPHLFAWSIAALIIYLINIFDTWFAYTRALSRWITQRRRSMMPPPIPPEKT